MKTIEVGLDKLNQIVKEIVDFKEGVVILRGDLASGKTTLVKAVATFLKIEEDVTSPTFSLQQCYGDKIYHYDIYNHGLEHFISLGMLEELEKEGLHFIEWGDEQLETLLKDVGIDVMSIEIQKSSQTTREYKICTN
jgi:tRNA threonylcarbamoyladenosine biosynthesis protein TsaE